MIVIIVLTAVKDAIEDYRRSNLDDVLNAHQRTSALIDQELDKSIAGLDALTLSLDSAKATAGLSDTDISPIPRGFLQALKFGRGSADHVPDPVGQP